MSVGRVMGRRVGRDEDGAVAIIVAASLVLLFMLVALAIDLGFARADVRSNQSASDFAAIAAAFALEDGYVAACQAAVRHVHANVDELASPPGVGVLDPCDDFELLDLGVCDEDTNPVTAVIEAPPYTILVTSPVPDSDPAMDVGGQLVSERDGDPCERFKVGIIRDRPFAFGPVTGAIQGNPYADAVSRYYRIEGTVDIASLVVLERDGCNVLTSLGSGPSDTGLYVRHRLDPVTDEILQDAIIAIDTSATRMSGSPPQERCSNNDAIEISSGDIQAGQVIDGTFVPGRIGMFALHVAGGQNLNAYDPGDVPGNLRPEPQRRNPPVTRQPVDHLVNCQTTYGNYGDAGGQRYPQYGDVGACPRATADPPVTAPFIDRLRAELQTGDLTADGFHEITSDQCRNDSAITNPAGVTKVWVNCNASDTRTPDSYTFTDVTHVVFNQHVPNQVSNLTVTGSSTVGAVLYFREGGRASNSTGTVTTLQNVFVYADQRADVAGIDINGGTVTWNGIRAAFDDEGRITHPDACVVTADLPVAACFAPLALWSNSNETHQFGGNGNQFISGTYFIPNARTTLRGSGNLDLRDAQFFTRALDARGGGTLEMIPNPETNIPFVEEGRFLIR